MRSVNASGNALLRSFEFATALGMRSRGPPWPVIGWGEQDGTGKFSFFRPILISANRFDFFHFLLPRLRFLALSSRSQ
jgi:hypothetical protein